MNAKERLESYNKSIAVSQELYGRAIDRLLTQANEDGLIITVATAPKEPLAMGRYDLETTVRPSRLTGQRLMALERDAARYAELLALNDVSYLTDDQRAELAALGGDTSTPEGL